MGGDFDNGVSGEGRASNDCMCKHWICVPKVQSMEYADKVVCVMPRTKDDGCFLKRRCGLDGAFHLLLYNAY
jgi:hypothetical protein